MILTRLNWTLAYVWANWLFPDLWLVIKFSFPPSHWSIHSAVPGRGTFGGLCSTMAGDWGWGWACGPWRPLGLMKNVNGFMANWDFGSDLGCDCWLTVMGVGILGNVSSPEIRVMGISYIIIFIFHGYNVWLYKIWLAWHNMTSIGTWIEYCIQLCTSVQSCPSYLIVKSYKIWFSCVDVVSNRLVKTRWVSWLCGEWGWSMICIM